MSTDLDSMEAATRSTVERAHRAYMEAALWASTDENGEPLDSAHDLDDIAPGARAQMLDDVAGFLAACWGFALDLSQLEPEQIGHDLWLTRNHHGAGFWDRGLGELGDKLTELAQAEGSCDLYVGDDGALYVS